jgi:hypothetical protein
MIGWIKWLGRWVACLALVIAASCLAFVLVSAMVLWVTDSRALAIYCGGMAVGVVVNMVSEIVYDWFFK